MSRSLRRSFRYRRQVRRAAVPEAPRQVLIELVGIPPNMFQSFLIMTGTTQAVTLSGYTTSDREGYRAVSVPVTIRARIA